MYVLCPCSQRRGLFFLCCPVTLHRCSINSLFIKIFLNYFTPEYLIITPLRESIFLLGCFGFCIFLYFVLFLLGSVQGNAQVLMLTGKALNVTPDYSPKAEELLSKAVKLEPELVEAWNQLGEVYWKKGDVAAAHTCFSGALTHVSLSYPPQKCRGEGQDSCGSWNFCRSLIK